MLFKNRVLVAKMLPLAEKWKKFLLNTEVKFKDVFILDYLHEKFIDGEIKMWFRFSTSNSCFLFFIPIIIDISSYKIPSLLHSGKLLQTTYFHSPGFLQVEAGYDF